jgi:hypothetical protein
MLTGDPEPFHGVISRELAIKRLKKGKSRINWIRNPIASVMDPPPFPSLYYLVIRGFIHVALPQDEMAP